MTQQRVQKTDAEWRRGLTPKQYHILREKGTEPAFSGKLWNEHAAGMYACTACGAPLFSSDAKFDSGTGWPSFYAPATDDAVDVAPDTSHSMRRTEALCARCGGHLGHVFDDLPAIVRRKARQAGGPKPTGKRYCINSVALKLEPKK